MKKHWLTVLVEMMSIGGTRVDEKTTNSSEETLWIGSLTDVSGDTSVEEQDGDIVIPGKASTNNND